MFANNVRQFAHKVRGLPGFRELEPAWKALHPMYDRAVRFMAEREYRSMPGGQDRWRFDGRYQDFPFERIEPHVYAWISNNVHSGDCFYDVGAFIGYHTLCAAKRVGDDGRVFTFEAAPSNVVVLEHNLKMNRMSARTKVFGVAVGDQDRHAVSFYLRREDPTTHSLAFIPEVDHVTSSTLVGVKVPMRAIDSIVDEMKQPPDLMKIDVEGAEGRVLAGASTTLFERRIPIVCAMHPMWLTELGDSPESILQLIRSLGYRVFDFNGREKTSFGFEEVLLLP